MFRQVVSCRWAEGVTLEDKQGFRDALDGCPRHPGAARLDLG